MLGTQADVLWRLVVKMQSSTSAYFEEKFKSNVCRAIGVIVKERTLQEVLLQRSDSPAWVAEAIPHLSHLLTSHHIKVQMYAAAALYYIFSSISDVKYVIMTVEALFQSIARRQERSHNTQQDRMSMLPPRQLTECNFQFSRLLRRMLEIADPVEFAIPNEPAAPRKTSNSLAEDVLFRIGYYSKDLLSWLNDVAQAVPLLSDAKTQLKTFEAAKNARLTAQLLLHIWSSSQGGLNVLQHSVRESLQGLCEPRATQEEQRIVSNRLDAEIDDEL